ncbi:hypothetical protein NUH16_008904 [Penicillium rubens]|nr:hypothetical protein NUH16_008904 [Penicillium rubens]
MSGKREKKNYDEDPVACIHYRVEWRVTVNSREERERQERLGKDKRKSGQVTGGGMPYAPRNIFNVLPSQTAAQEPDSPVAKAAIEGLGTVPIGHGSDFVPP